MDYDNDDYREYNGDPVHDMYVDDFYDMNPDEEEEDDDDVEP